MNHIIHSFAYCLDYLREQVADVSAEQMSAQPKGNANHPAWVVGHLTYSCQAIGGEIGLDPWLPASWPERFATGSVPSLDPSVYSDKDTLLKSLRDARSRITQAVQQLDTADVNKPLPDEKYRVLLPTVGHAITHVLIAHPAYHIGQLTSWRRAMGLPRITRHFA